MRVLGPYISSAGGWTSRNFVGLDFCHTMHGQDMARIGHMWSSRNIINIYYQQQVLEAENLGWFPDENRARYTASTKQKPCQQLRLSACPSCKSQLGSLALYLHCNKPGTLSKLSNAVTGHVKPDGLLRLQSISFQQPQPTRYTILRNYAMSVNRQASAALQSEYNASSLAISTSLANSLFALGFS